MATDRDNTRPAPFDRDSIGMYPLLLDLAGRAVLVVGGGLVAERRVAGLLDAGARVKVVAPTATDALVQLARNGRIEWAQRGFEPGDVIGRTLVFTATDVLEVDTAVAQEARVRGIFVNSADDNERCDFHVPAVARRGDIVIAVGTGGAAPALAARLRDRFAGSLGPEWERLATLLGQMRDLARERIADRGARARALSSAARDAALLARLARGEEVDAAEALGRAQAEGAAPAPAAAVAAPAGASCAEAPQQAAAPAWQVPPLPEGAFVSLVGAGPGAPDLLTARAYDRIAAADVIIYDDLVDRTVLDAARPEAELVYSGKRGWQSGPDRPGPELLAERALEAGGKRVVRLKGGDPNVFGRSTEELEVLETAGVPYEIVPGITAALAAAAAAHIPLTQRGVAGSLTLATGVAMGASGEASAASESGGARNANADLDQPTPADIASLARAGSTVAVYMGLRVLPQIADALLAAGVSAELPVAVIGSASLPGEIVVKARLADIAERVAEAGVPSPAIAILGEVAR